MSFDIWSYSITTNFFFCSENDEVKDAANDRLVHRGKENKRNEAKVKGIK